MNYSKHTLRQSLLFAFTLFVWGCSTPPKALVTSTQSNSVTEKKLPADLVLASDMVQVVLLAGQSNMSGFGDFDKLSEIDKQRVALAAKRVSVSVMGKKPKPLSYKKAHRSQVEKYTLTKTFGPELFMGVMLAERFPDEHFLLIKNSQGGTSLYGAWNPYWSKEKAQLVENKKFKQSHSFQQAHLKSIKDNLTRLSRLGKKYQVIGMAWMQGENDAAKEISAVTYQANLNALIASYRTAVKQPNMPFVIGQINSNYGRFKAGPEMVRNAQKQVALKDRYAALIPTTTDKSWADYPKHFGVHYNTEGQKRLGTAFYQELLRLMSSAN